MIAKNNESMKAFTFSLKQLTDDEKIQMQCEAREMYEHDKASFIHQGFKKGVEQEKKKPYVPKNGLMLLNKEILP